MTTKPLHVGTVCGQPVRFFKTPNDDGRPDFPWHSVDDMQRAIGLPDDARKVLMRNMRTVGGEDLFRTIATPEGLVTVAPHFMAQGMLDAAVATGKVSPAARSDYDRAGTPAFKALTAHLSINALLDWTKAAWNRHA